VGVAFLLATAGVVGGAVLLAGAAPAAKRAVAGEKEEPVPGGGSKAEGAIQEIRESDFDEVVTRANIPVLVDFTAAWCSACKVMRPEIQAFAKGMGGKVKVVAVDFDASPKLARKHGVTGLPTLLLFDHGEVVERRVGVQRRADLDMLVVPYISGTDEP